MQAASSSSSSAPAPAAHVIKRRRRWSPEDAGDEDDDDDDEDEEEERQREAAERNFVFLRDLREDVRARVVVVDSPRLRVKRGRGGDAAGDDMQGLRGYVVKLHAVDAPNMAFIAGGTGRKHAWARVVRRCLDRIALSRRTQHLHNINRSLNLVHPDRDLADGAAASNDVDDDLEDELDLEEEDDCNDGLAFARFFAQRPESALVVTILAVVPADRVSEYTCQAIKLCRTVAPHGLNTPDEEHAWSDAEEERARHPLAHTATSPYPNWWAFLNSVGRTELTYGDYRMWARGQRASGRLTRLQVLTRHSFERILVNGTTPGLGTLACRCVNNKSDVWQLLAKPHQYYLVRISDAAFVRLHAAELSLDRFLDTVCLVPDMSAATAVYRCAPFTFEYSPYWPFDTSLCEETWTFASTQAEALGPPETPARLTLRNVLDASPQMRDVFLDKLWSSSGVYVNSEPVPVASPRPPQWRLLACDAGSTCRCCLIRERIKCKYVHALLL